MDSTAASRMTRRMAASSSPRSSTTWYARRTQSSSNCQSRCSSKCGPNPRLWTASWKRRASPCLSVISRHIWRTRGTSRRSSYSSSSRGLSDAPSSSSGTAPPWTSCSTWLSSQTRAEPMAKARAKRSTSSTMPQTSSLSSFLKERKEIWSPSSSNCSQAQRSWRTSKSSPRKVRFRRGRSRTSWNTCVDSWKTSNSCRKASTSSSQCISVDNKCKKYIINWMMNLRF